MASDEFKSYSADDFITDIKQRFYPRDLILDDASLHNVLYRCIEQLNLYCYQQRYLQVACGAGFADLSTVSTILDGTEAKKVTSVWSTKQINTFFTIYTQILGSTPMFYSLLHNQSQFIDFILTQQLATQLNRKFKNKEMMYYFNAHDGKLLLDMKAFANDTEVVVGFYPHFILSEDAWHLHDVEAIFVGNLFEAMVSMREGRSQSELNFTEFNHNADLLSSDGKERIKEVIDEFVKPSVKMLGRRF